MHPDIADGLTLMAVGMITVFIALGLVAAIGQGLIWLVNRYAPPTPLPSYPPSEPISGSTASITDLDGTRLAVILAAVEAATKGRGRITQIEKATD